MLRECSLKIIFATIILCSGVFSFRMYGQDIKLLEHSCFPGKSLRFQNQFFLSPYKILPKNPMSAVVDIVLQSGLEESIQDNILSDSIFMYHQHYRPDCYDILRNALAYIGEIKLAYTQDNFPYRSLINVVNPYIRIYNSMYQAWQRNDYPVLMKISKEGFMLLAGREHKSLFG